MCAPARWRAIAAGCAGCPAWRCWRGWRGGGCGARAVMAGQLGPRVPGEGAGGEDRIGGFSGAFVVLTRSARTAGRVCGVGGFVRPLRSYRSCGTWGSWWSRLRVIGISAMTWRPLWPVWRRRGWWGWSRRVERLGGVQGEEGGGVGGSEEGARTGSVVSVGSGVRGWCVRGIGVRGGGRGREGGEGGVACGGGGGGVGSEVFQMGGDEGGVHRGDVEDVGAARGGAGGEVEELAEGVAGGGVGDRAVSGRGFRRVGESVMKDRRVGGHEGLRAAGRGSRGQSEQGWDGPEGTVGRLRVAVAGRGRAHRRPRVTAADVGGDGGRGGDG